MTWSIDGKTSLVTGAARMGGPSATSQASLAGRTCLVTGANSGIGYETARGLAHRGADVVLHGRREAPLKAAVERIEAEDPDGALDTVLGDYADLADVRRMAKELHHRLDRLDVLVNNAGAILGERHVTTDGNEQQFQVNHLAPFLLTHELLPMLLESTPSRIVTVASEAHWNAGSLPEGFQRLDGRYRSFRTYGQTKLYNILFTKALARRLDPEQVTANCLHPGVIGSRFGNAGPWYVRAFMAVARPLLKGPEKGARTSRYLAASDEVSGVTGKYFAKCKPKECSKQARDQALQEALWRESERLTGADGWPNE